MTILILFLTLFRASADTPSTHGMVLFGKNVTYASHLPMFHPLHNYQVILKITLANLNGSDAADSFHQQKETFNSYFTLVPEKMDLTKIMDGSKKMFKAEIFKGHFERGGKSLGFAAVTIEKIVYAEKLAPTFILKNDFLVFGDGPEFFAVHLITSRPSYDAILKLDFPLSKAVPKNISAISDWIPEESSIGAFTDPAIRIVQTIYTEEDELH